MTFFKKIAPITLASFLALSASAAVATGDSATESTGVFNAQTDSSPDAQTPGQTGTAMTNDGTAMTGETMRNCETSGVFNSANDSAPDAMTPGCTGTALENNETAMTGEEDKEASGVFNPANDSSPDAQTPGHTGTADSN